jgi:hypothetical protein
MRGRLFRIQLAANLPHPPNPDKPVYPGNNPFMFEAFLSKFARKLRKTIWEPVRQSGAALPEASPAPWIALFKKYNFLRLHPPAWSLLSHRIVTDERARTSFPQACQAPGRLNVELNEEDIREDECDV